MLSETQSRSESEGTNRRCSHGAVGLVQCENYHSRLEQKDPHLIMTENIYTDPTSDLFKPIPSFLHRDKHYRLDRRLNHRWLKGVDGDGV